MTEVLGSRGARAWKHAVLDLIILFGVIGAVTSWMWGIGDVLTSSSVMLGIPIAVGIVLYLIWEGVYEVHARRWPSAVAIVARGVTAGASAFALSAFAMGIGDGARRWVGVVSVIWFIALALHHGLRAASEKNLSRVIVAGNPQQAMAMRDLLLRDRRRSHHVVGFVVDDLDACRWSASSKAHLRGAEIPRDSELGMIDDLPRLAEIYNANQVIFCMGGLTGGRFAQVARSLSRMGVDVAMTGIGDVAPRRVASSHIAGRPIVSIAPSAVSSWQLGVKRLVDILVSGMLLVLLAPLMAVVAVLIRVVDGNSPIFAQRRVGKGGEVFTIYKFQTMVADAEELKIDLTNEYDGPIFKMESDPRITSIGGFLRKASIDELPQLFNVLRGDMSLVGPRPFVESEVYAAPEAFRHREAVTPGMTGAWQVSGRSDTDFDELEELDRWYVDNWSLGEDLGILAKTVPAVLRQKGAR